MNSPEPNEQKLERFARALRDAEQNRCVFVAPTIDEAILKQARKRFERPQPRRSFRFWFGWVGAAAAVSLLVFLTPLSQTPVAAREDINGDGKVDILDALALAKALQSGAQPAKFDQNSDGKIDDADVRAVATAAVRLDSKS
jgi:hypothetical protein